MADAATSVPASSGIISAVSGDAEPVFGVEEVAAAAKAKGTDALDSGAEAGGNEAGPVGVGEHAMDGAVTDRSAGGISGMDDVESLFMDDDTSQGAPAEGEPDELPEELQDASERAQKRFRSLSSRVKEAEAHNAKWQEWSQGAQQKFNQMQQGYAQQNQQLQIELARVGARMEAYEKGIVPKQAEEDPGETFRQNLINEAKEKLSPEVKALQNRIDQMQQREQQARQKFQRESRKFEINQTANDAAGEHMTKGLSEEFSHLQGPLGTLAVAWAHGRGVSIPAAAQELKQIMSQWSRGHIRARGAAKGKQLQSSQQTTSPSRKARPHASGSGTMSYQDSRKAGFANPLQAMMAQGGPLGNG